MPSTAKKLLSPGEYLALERKAEVKSEFCAGEIYAMAGGTKRHSRIAVNIAGALNRRFVKGACQVFNSDMRLKIEATGLYTYPDIQVACGKLSFEDEVEDTLLNPRIIFEVLSEATAAWDRGGKFWHYRHLETLSEYVLVSQDAWLIEHYIRHPEGAWLMEAVENGKGLLHLKSIRCRVPLTEIYANTGVPAQSQPGR